MLPKDCFTHYSLFKYWERLVCVGDLDSMLGVRITVWELHWMCVSITCGPPEVYHSLDLHFCGWKWNRWAFFRLQKPLTDSNEALRRHVTVYCGSVNLKVNLWHKWALQGNAVVSFLKFSGVFHVNSLWRNNTWLESFRFTFTPCLLFKETYNFLTHK